MQRPDFIIVGGQFDGKAWLLASKRVRDITLDVQHSYEEVHSYDHAGTYLTDTSVEIHAKVRDFIQVMGDTYGEAWSDLFKNWKPDSKDELPGQKMLP